MSAPTKEELLALKEWHSSLEHKGMGRILVGVYLEGAFALALGISSEEMKERLKFYYEKGAAL